MNKKRKISEETRRKMSEARKEYWRLNKNRIKNRSGNLGCYSLTDQPLIPNQVLFDFKNVDPSLITKRIVDKVLGLFSFLK